MNKQLIYITIILFFIISILFVCLMLTGNWEYFVYELKWLMRIISPFFIIYFFYLGIKKRG